MNEPHVHLSRMSLDGEDGPCPGCHARENEMKRLQRLLNETATEASSLNVEVDRLRAEIQTVRASIVAPEHGHQGGMMAWDRHTDALNALDALTQPTKEGT